jgi:hypothetical protein
LPQFFKVVREADGLSYSTIAITKRADTSLRAQPGTRTTVGSRCRAAHLSRRTSAAMFFATARRSNSGAALGDGEFD